MLFTDLAYEPAGAPTIAMDLEDWEPLRHTVNEYFVIRDPVHPAVQLASSESCPRSKHSHASRVTGGSDNSYLLPVSLLRPHPPSTLRHRAVYVTLETLTISIGTVNTCAKGRTTISSGKSSSPSTRARTSHSAATTRRIAQSEHQS
jgi:hypothetical protein